MKEHSEKERDWKKLREKVLGLGEKSHQKSYFPAFKKRLSELERLYLILDYSIDAIFRVELPSYKIFDMNTTSKSLFTKADNNCSDILFRNIVSAKDWGKIESFFKSENSESQNSIKIETTLNTISNPELPVEMTIGLHRDEHSAFALIIARDLTERKIAEETIRKSEEKYRTYITNSPDAIFVMNENGKLIEVNHSACSLTGYSPVESRQIRLVDLVVPSGQENFLASFEELKNKGKIYRELKCLNKEKNEFFILLDAVKIDDENYVAFCRDITEKKKSDINMQRLATAIEQAAEDIMITDTSGKIEFVNPAFEKITGYSREEVIGQNPRLLKSGKHDGVFYENLWNTIKNGKVWHGKISNRRKDGNIIEEETTISPIFDKNGNILAYVALKRDVTEQAKLEIMYRQSQKMEAVGLLAGGVAHDFNNLLQAIQGYTDMALMELSDDSPVRSDLDEVIKASNKAKTLIRQLLTFSRKESVIKEVVDLNDIIYNLMKMVQRVIGEHIELQINLAPSLKKIFADPGQIEQIIMNLCVNARDAMSEGGKITIETGNVFFSEEYRMLNNWAKSGFYAKLSIADTGAGIPKELHEKIFEPFFTTKNVGEGTGLGLATVYAITERHNGMINLYSEPGKGTIFRLYFPALEKSDELKEVVEEVDDEKRYASPGAETVLFAEDDDQIRKLSVKLLEKYGYKVLIARNGEEAIWIVEKYKENIDIAILDVVMPKKGGRHVYDKLIEYNLNIPVIFTSGYSFDALLDKEWENEKFELIQKPYAPKELLLKIKETLEIKKK